MRRQLNHARQFRFSVKRPENTDSKQLLKWLYTNLGQSSAMDLQNGVWFFDVDNNYPYEAKYWFKHEKDAVYFRMAWE